PFFFSSRRRHTRFSRDWSSDVCSSDLSQLMGIRRIVEKLGHEAITAEDGAAGVRAAQEHLPDLILMDVVMPNLNGFQATRTIKRDAATGHIPVILVTTKDQETDRKASCRERVEISEVGASIKKNAEKE